MSFLFTFSLPKLPFPNPFSIYYDNPRNQAVTDDANDYKSEIEVENYHYSHDRCTTRDDIRHKRASSGYSSSHDYGHDESSRKKKLDANTRSGRPGALMTTPDNGARDWYSLQDNAHDHDHLQPATRKRKKTDTIYEEDVDKDASAAYVYASLYDQPRSSRSNRNVYRSSAINTYTSNSHLSPIKSLFVHDDIGQQDDVTRPPPNKKQKLGVTEVAGSIISTAISVAIVSTTIGYTAYKLWRDRGKSAAIEDGQEGRLDERDYDIADFPDEYDEPDGQEEQDFRYGRCDHRFDRIRPRYPEGHDEGHGGRSASLRLQTHDVCERERLQGTPRKRNRDRKSQDTVTTPGSSGLHSPPPPYGSYSPHSSHASHEFEEASYGAYASNENQIRDERMKLSSYPSPSTVYDRSRYDSCDYEEEGQFGGFRNERRYYEHYDLGNSAGYAGDARNPRHYEDENDRHVYHDHKEEVDERVEEIGEDDDRFGDGWMNFPMHHTATATPTPTLRTTVTRRRPAGVTVVRTVTTKIGRGSGRSNVNKKRQRNLIQTTPKKKSKRDTIGDFTFPEMSPISRRNDIRSIGTDENERDDMNPYEVLDEQMDWMSERLKGLIEHGKRALASPIRVPKNIPVEDGRY